VTPCAARLVAPTNRVARPATAPSVQREIFIRWVFPRGVDALRLHLSMSHTTSEVECVSSPENRLRGELLAARLRNDSVTATTGESTCENGGSDERGQCMVRGGSWRIYRSSTRSHCWNTRSTRSRHLRRANWRTQVRSTSSRHCKKNRGREANVPSRSAHLGRLT
jgi:hypothetical protein